MKKNKNGVKNSLVNNINARKKKGRSRPKKKSTVSEKAYSAMQNNWDRSPARKGKKTAKKAAKKKSAPKKTKKKTARRSR
ncbi:MAG TPA: hypothetical protein VGD40_24750 [Chryseosolibacter sp.]